MLRSATTNDAVQICQIYNHYVLQTTITFEEQPVTPDDMLQRIRETTEGLPWIIAEQDGRLLGFCYASKWKGRCAYRYSVESTVYLRPDSLDQGIGSKLYAALLNELRERQMHTVMGGIALPNEASVIFHEKFGFEKVAHFKEVGRKFDNWIDVGYWQLRL
jgi:L-amino acid N-acyltransferase YncA